jgi:hypothetical protein
MNSLVAGGYKSADATNSRCEYQKPFTVTA